MFFPDSDVAFRGDRYVVHRGATGQRAHTFSRAALQCKTTHPVCAFTGESLYDSIDAEFDLDARP
ncbi:MAG: hypothetical protein WDZ63_13730 [Burkholderiales bacterium]